MEIAFFYGKSEAFASFGYILSISALLVTALYFYGKALGRFKWTSAVARRVEWAGDFLCIGSVATVLLVVIVLGTFYVDTGPDAREKDRRTALILESKFSLGWEAHTGCVLLNGGPGTRQIELFGRSTDRSAEGLVVRMTEAEFGEFSDYLVQRHPEVAARVAANAALLEASR